ncbi:MAG: hypothetical protein A3E85_04600 [Gammaproteobacteria bacterium RIFCSPHIGHO2_12_FULL_45_12]|nr:MAG: hypothetical protein A3E85_04600 [Gammaproteobacteria bacterium RIFCSPHIGHO2_12_FULL_45_12]
MLEALAGTLKTTVQQNISLFGLRPDIAIWLWFAMLMAGIGLASLILFYVSRFIALKFVANLIRNGKFPWINVANQCKVFDKLIWFVPLLFLYVAMPLMTLINLSDMEIMVSVIQQILMIVMIGLGVFVTSAMLNSINAIYHQMAIARQYSIKSYIQFIKMIVYLFGMVLIVSALLDKSPAYLLTGLGAMTAIGMLVFKDSILGMVASIQMTAYDIVRVGDWIEIPDFGADGTVLDISLNTIKVRNFDNTIVTIPSYVILTNGIKNWRGMKESGGRRIKRSFFVDVNSIKFCDSALIEKISRIGLLKSTLSALLGNQDENRAMMNEGITAVFQTDHCVTNLTVFRTYLELYLKQHPRIHSQMTLLVRELQDQGSGIPVELYVFTSDTDWNIYESVQAEIFDHIFAVLPLFDLMAFQHLSGPVNQTALPHSAN